MAGRPVSTRMLPTMPPPAIEPKTAPRQAEPALGDRVREVVRDPELAVVTGQLDHDPVAALNRRDRRSTVGPGNGDEHALDGGSAGGVVATEEGVYNAVVLQKRGGGR
jgi:hypothetical protein